MGDERQSMRMRLALPMQARRHDLREALAQCTLRPTRYCTKNPTHALLRRRVLHTKSEGGRQSTFDDPTSHRRWTGNSRSKTRLNQIPKGHSRATASLRLCSMSLATVDRPLESNAFRCATLTSSAACSAASTNNVDSSTSITCNGSIPFASVRPLPMAAPACASAAIRERSFLTDHKHYSCADLANSAAVVKMINQLRTFFECIKAQERVVAETPDRMSPWPPQRRGHPSPCVRLIVWPLHATVSALPFATTTGPSKASATACRVGTAFAKALRTQAWSFRKQHVQPQHTFSERRLHIKLC